MSWQTFAARPSSVKIYTAEISVADPANPSADREVLYFSSDTLNPALTDIYHEPCIQQLPTFTRSLQAVASGRTSAAFGTLTLLIGDGHLDSMIASHVFAGADVVIKLGFDGLPAAEFKEIFTGYVTANPKPNDTQMTLPLADKVRQLLDHKLTEQTLSGALPSVISTLLDSASVPAAKRNVTMWDAWSAENNFNVWLPVSKNQTVASVLDSLLAPLGCWFGFGRDGFFRVATFAAPAADAVADIELTDIELTEFKGEQAHSDHAWKVVVSYYSATGEIPETSERSWEDLTIKNLNPSAVEISKNTALTSSVNADTVRDRWKALLSAFRKVAHFTAEAELFGLHLGDIVRVTRERFDLNALYVVRKVTDNMTSDSVTLELFR